MSTFWSGYIALLTLGTIVALFWLIFATRKGESAGTTDQTMGHAFDGIEEYDNPLPRWWFLLFIGTLVFGILYLVLYPGLGNWKGVLPGYEGGWTQEKQWEREVSQADEKYGPIFAKYAAMSVEQVAQDPQAVKMGARLFANYCAICHGSDAKGSLGFPNLADQHWRWGGDATSIKTSILNGRIAAMPAWGQAIGEEGVKNVAAFVRNELAGLPLPEGTDADLGKGGLCADLRRLPRPGWRRHGRAGRAEPAACLRLDLRFEPGPTAADHPSRPQRPDAGSAAVPGQRQGASARCLRLQLVEKPGTSRQAVSRKRAVHSYRPSRLVPRQLPRRCDYLSHPQPTEDLPPPQLHF